MAARRELGRWTPGHLVTVTVAALVLGFLILPIFVVVPISFSQSALLQFPPKAWSLRWFDSYFSSSAWIDATIMSFKVGASVMLLSVLLAIPAAIGITRGSFRGRAVIQAILLSPLIVPVIIIAVALYYAFSLFRLNGTYAGLVLGHTVLALPYATVVITASLERMDPRLEQVAVSLGAHPFRAFYRVTLPLIRSGVAVAAFFAFLTSFDEVVMAIFITGPQTLTLPKKMWDGIRFELDPTIAAVSTVLVLFSWVLVLLGEAIRRRVDVVTAYKAAR